MADQRVRAIYEAEVAGYNRAMAEAARQTEALAKAADKTGQATQKMGDSAGKGAEQARGKLATLSDAVRQNRADMEQLGGDMLKWGAGLTGLAAASGKFAMDWESDWTGVLKTNDGTSEQIARLEGDLRGLAKTLPATHSEIAAVAEAAGQLGVGIDDVSAFTKTMIDLGESTNLSAEEAATSIARFANITGLALSDVDQLGSALVGLGNNFATTEAEIMHMSMRVAAVGTQVGMTEGEILGLATAMSSVGIEAEAGGTAISMVMKKIDASVREGGDSLTGWAEAAGVSAQEFAAAWQNEPSVAMEMLVTGLGETAAAGGDVNGMLAELGVTGIRESDTLLRLASAGELLGDAFRTGNEELAKGSALAEEASKRYETTESKIRIAWNNIKDAAIDAGAVLLPVIAQVAEGAASLAGAFSALPGPVKGGVAALSGVAGVGLLAAGALLTLAPRVLDTVDSLKRLNTEFPKAAGAAGKFAKGIGIASAALVGFEVLKGIANDAVPAAAGLESVANALMSVAESGDMAALDEIFNRGTKELTGFVDAVNLMDPSTLNAHMESFGESFLGLRTETAQAREQLVELDQVLATMDAGSAAEQMNRLREELEASGNMDLSNWEGLKRLFPEYAASVEAAANATGQATSEADLFQAAMGNLPPHMINTGEAAETAKSGTELFTEALSGSAEAAQELDDALKEALNGLREMGIVPRNAQAANDAYQASLDALTASVKENGQTLDENTEKGRANREALRSHTDAGLANAAAMAEAGASQGEVSGALMDLYESTVASAEAMGLSATEAELYAKDLLDIPTDIDVDVQSKMDTKALEVAELTGAAISGIPMGVQVLADMSPAAAEQAFKTAEAIKVIPGYKRVDVAVDDQGTPGQIQSRINALTGKTEYVFVTDDDTVNVTQQKIMGIDGKTEYVYVTDDGTVVATQGSINNIEGTTADVVAVPHTGNAERALNQVSRDRVANVIGKVTMTGSAALRKFGQFAFAQGGVVGSLPGFSTGGVLPRYGKGTDTILGIGSSGMPTAWVDDGEWVVRRTSSQKYNRLLGLVNRDDPSVQHLAGYASGGPVGREWSASAVAPAVQVGPVAASVDSSVIASAVASAISSYQPVVKIGMREFIGEMKQDRAWKGAS